MTARASTAVPAPRRLFAKSFKGSLDNPPPFALLTQHSRDVVEACRALAHAVGHDALRVADLPSETFERFERTLRLDGWLQDLGKANQHFQAMVSGQPDIVQPLRHEALSGLLAWRHAELRAWLEPFGDDLVFAIWGALGHHRKFTETFGPVAGDDLVLHASHDDFRTILHEVAEDLDLGAPPVFSADLRIGTNGDDSLAYDAQTMLDDARQDFQKHEEKLGDLQTRQFLALVKAFGIAADVTASAIAKRENGTQSPIAIRTFIAEQLSVGLTSDDIAGLVRRWAWNNVASAGRKRDETMLPPEFVVRPFQQAVAASSSFLTLAQAGCGSGKSLAAYLWAQRWCERLAGEGIHKTRLFFCLPTTGTTTEHFKDYALEAGLASSLAHSRATVDLVAIARTAAQEDEPDKAKQIEEVLASERAKIEALSLWSTPLVVCTADAVLGLMANGLRAVCTLPALVEACIVFDEIHAFDDQLFGHLLMFLRTFPKLPVLVMTASLPEARRAALLAVRPDLVCVPGPPELEDLQRYHIRRSRDQGEIWESIERCTREGGKVLWVRNQVRWANEAYAEARARFPRISVDVYHSRFRYKDRSDRHRRVIDRFKSTQSATVLVATQVAEMSLDLSADLLVTDMAPVPSLIQRLGRLHRRAHLEPSSSTRPALLCALPPGKPLPYCAEELRTAQGWVDRLQALGRPVSQRDLSELFEAFCKTRDVRLVDAERNAGFLGAPRWAGLWRTEPGQTRSDGVTMQVVLQADLDQHRRETGELEPDRDWLRMHEVSIPMKGEMFGWERVRGVLVAPAKAVSYDYDDATGEGTGAQWQEK